MSIDNTKPYGVAVCIAGGACPATEIAGHEIIQSNLFKGNSVWIIREGLGGLLRNVAFEQVDVRKQSYIEDLMQESSRDYVGNENAELVAQNLQQQTKDLGIRIVNVIGGDGTATGLGRAARLAEKGQFPHIHFAPKTIDGDVMHTDTTIGFASAIEAVDSAMKSVRRDSLKMRRAYFMQIPGRDSGNLTLHSAKGHADIILVPEAPFDEGVIHQAVRERYLQQGHCVIAVSEGFVPNGVDEASIVRKDAFGNGAKYRVGDYLAGSTRQAFANDEEVLSINPNDSKRFNSGSFNSEYARGVVPNHEDTETAIAFGKAMSEYGLQHAWDTPSSLAFVRQQGKIIPIPLENIAGKTKFLSEEEYIRDRLFINNHKAGLFS